ncbi:hypothetical protein AB0O64_08685 [Streptomyces sp. NPDC088341]|uniref:hypothetical protein n=1 Tax=Streptomyces sp. NPDC088341 TaxID=3154870 RepID=UPI00342D641D
MLRRRMRFAAVLVVVVLALTGFSSGKGKSKGSSGGGGGGGGGGCSSSKKSNGGYVGAGAGSDYDSDYDSGDDYNGSSSGSTADPYATSSDTVRARVVTCVRKASGKRKAVTYATVRVEAPTGTTGVYEIDVDFKDASGTVVDSADTEVTLESGESKTLRIAMDFPKQVTRVRACEARATAAG